MKRIISLVIIGLILQIFYMNCAPSPVENNGSSSKKRGETNYSETELSLLESWKSTCNSNVWCVESKIVESTIHRYCPYLNTLANDPDQGAVGYCYHEIAKKMNDASICAYIVKADTRSLCESDTR